MATRLQTNKRWSQQRHGHILNQLFTSLQTKMDQQSLTFTIAKFTNIVRNPSEYSDCSSGNTNNNVLRCSVSNHSLASTESYNSIRSAGFASLPNSNTEKFKRRPLLKLAIVIGVVLVLAGIAAAVTVLLLMPDHQYITPVEMIVRVEDNYTDEMNNTSSEVFQRFTDSFCSNLTNSLLRNNTEGVRCQVNSLSKGSIIVNCTVYVVTKNHPTEESIMGKLQSEPPWQNVTVNTTNVKISIGYSKNYIDEFPAQMDIFNCLSQRDGTLLPLNDTYPDNCRSFQICENGKGTHVSCDDNFYFAIMESSACIPQDFPSTYCNKSRSKDSIAMKPSEKNEPITHTTMQHSFTTLHWTSSSIPKILTSLTVPVTITVASMSGGTESISSPRTETTDSTTHHSSSTTGTTWMEAPSYITEVSRLSTLYSTTPPTEVNCTGLNGDYFPSRDTYPSKCDQFIRCVNGEPVLRNCSACTYFTTETHVCDWYYAPNTYCAMQDSKTGNNSSNFLPKCNNKKYTKNQ